MSDVVGGVAHVVVRGRESVTGVETADTDFAGRPTESSVSTMMVPLPERLASSAPGTGMTFFMCVGKPLGVTVVSWTDAASRPTDDAEIEVVPAVEVVGEVRDREARPSYLIITLPEMDPYRLLGGGQEDRGVVERQ